MPSILFDRQACVTHLYDGLPDKSKIQTSKRLERIEHTETGVRVHLADGTIEEGDIIIGADGVHSTTRKLMWDYASDHAQYSIPDSDKTVMFSQFSGLFGVSTQEPYMNLGPSDSHVIYGQDVTKLLFTQPGKAYWAVIFKDEYSRPAKRWKPTDEEVEAVARKYGDVPMTESVRLEHLWKTKTRQGLLSFEEGVLSKWHAGRIVLVGDSAHKMTADLALGANIAVESGVYLANILHRELKANPSRHMSTSELSALFAEYQQGRFDRASAFVDISGKVTRMHSYQTCFKRFWAGYIAPYVAPMQTLKFAESFGKAPKLDYVPVRTVDENAEGWRLGEKKREGMRWGMYLVVGATVGAAIAWWATSTLSLIL
jgi:FAD dependent monooxygenase